MTEIRRVPSWMTRWADRLARWVITGGGLLVIGSVLAILFLLVGVIFPLFQAPKAELRAICSLQELSSETEAPAALGVDLVEIGRSGEEDLLSGYLLSRTGEFLGFELVRPPEGSRHAPEAVLPNVIFRKTLHPPRAGRSSDDSSASSSASASQAAGSPAAASPAPVPMRIAHAQSIQPDRWTLLWANGGVSLVHIQTEIQFDDLGHRSLRFQVQERVCLPPASEAPQPIQALIHLPDQSDGEDWLAAILLADNRILLRRQTVRKDLFGESGEKTISDHWIRSGIPGRVTAMTLNHQGATLFVGTDTGYVVRWKIEEDGRPVQPEAVWTPGRSPVTALSVLFGDVSLVVGSQLGDLSLWFPVRKEEPISPGDRPDRLVPIRSFVSQQGEVRTILPSQRNKILASLGSEGIVHLDYGSTGRHLLTLEAPDPLRQAAYSPRGNAVLGLGEQRQIYVWRISAPHADVSWPALFGKVWYESHEKPKFLWQSSGTDEPKMNLVPLIFGTLKATVYAMLFALPLGLGSAIYVSQFTKPELRRTIKPIVEIMAAIPTVVIGFLILLWAAPLVGRWVLAILIAALSLPVSFALWMFLWQGIRRWRAVRWIETGYEFLMVIPAILLGLAGAALAALWMEQAWFQGDFRQWLFDHAGLRYDQLNALVVALGLGFTIIPIIFSISEDAFSSIPHSLTAASLALGASRWQTLWRVVLPSASPGIFAAVMIGLGRAVGETMIVFMATGNTPILDPSPFNGFRTLSANIAVEISEHPRDGTLYRVLFLCAVILFVMTFVLNTAAELVRIRLRRKFGQY